MTASEATTRNELAWLANCYVAGELSVDEAAAFESRLETDVAACSAVARAMELNLAIAAAFDSQPSALSPQPSVISPARWSGATITALAASAVAAASVALMIGYSGSATNGEAYKDGADRLVAAWASGEAARNDDDDDDLLDGADDADLDPPDWMLAALTVEKEQLPRHDEVREN
ncbi:MAG: hypothetical protein IAG10_30945 [Planctomycetaceae bacterium]|nr:hypothetical protein [Planctomycetaceae bacterium]